MLPRNTVKKCYNGRMLSVRHNRLTGGRELHLGDVPVEACIVPIGRAHVRERCDWQLWVARAPGCPATLDKSPTRLAVESRLRAWLLRRCRRCLFTMSFEELCSAAELASGTTTRRAR